MAARIIDVDTTVRPFRTVQPTRRTQSDQDTVRVSVGLDLQEIINAETGQGTDKFDLTRGLDVVLILDAETSDTERSRQVAQVILANQYVTGFIEEPAVTLGTAPDGTPQYQIKTVVETVFGPVPLEF